MSQGCGKADNNGKTVSGSKLPCGTKLSYGVGKGVPKREVVHLCAECAKEEPCKTITDSHCSSVSGGK
jgi:hypothetical protein